MLVKNLQIKIFKRRKSTQTKAKCQHSPQRTSAKKHRLQNRQTPVVQTATQAQRAHGQRVVQHHAEAVAPPERHHSRQRAHVAEVLRQPLDDDVAPRRRSARQARRLRASQDAADHRLEIRNVVVLEEVVFSARGQRAVFYEVVAAFVSAVLYFWRFFRKGG